MSVVDVAVNDDDDENNQTNNNGMILVYTFDFLTGISTSHDTDDTDTSNANSTAAANKNKEQLHHQNQNHHYQNIIIALGQAEWCNTFWIPTQQRKHSNLYKLRIEHCKLFVYQIATTTNNNSNNIVTVDWNKLLVTTALKKIHVEDLGDLSAMELLASIPKQDDSEGRGIQDLERMEKQLSVKVVWILDDTNFNNNNNDMKSDNSMNIVGHVLLVGAKTKLEKKCLVIRNILSHYYWRLKGKQINL